MHQLLHRLPGAPSPPALLASACHLTRVVRPPPPAGREVALGGQPVRLPDDLRLLQGPRAVHPARPQVGHPHGARTPRRHDRRRCRGGAEVPAGASRLRAGAGGLRDQDAHARARDRPRRQRHDEDRHSVRSPPACPYAPAPPPPPCCAATRTAARTATRTATRTAAHPPPRPPHARSSTAPRPRDPTTPRPRDSTPRRAPHAEHPPTRPAPASSTPPTTTTARSS